MNTSTTNLEFFLSTGSWRTDHIPHNIKRMFLPDPGYTLIEGDLSGADAYAVAWDSGDERLKEKLKHCEATGTKLHTLNAEDIFGAPVTQDKYQKAKIGVHAVDYGCKARTLAQHLGCTIADAERFINRWFSAHPGIADWHRRVESDLFRTRTVRNAYGFRRTYFDRVETILPEALAWIGQSTTAITINKALVQVEDRVPEIEVLLQVHDSLLMQCQSRRLQQLFPQLRLAFRVNVPYPDPLIIPTEFKMSDKSWGNCEKVKLAA